jgi:tRNA(fMet)-specific endonuclease VapC
MFGVEVSPKRRQDEGALASFLRYVEVLDFPDEACLHYAKIRAELKARGTMIGANDLFIAAHARSLSLTLITNNTREFKQVRGLSIDNWTTTV